MRTKAAAKRIIGTANRPLARRRLQVAKRQTTGPYKIEIGANRSGRPGWIATDNSWRTRLLLDVGSAPWPFDDTSVSHIYGDNMVEHLRMAQARVMLAEAFRVLVPGGRIRLVTPDVERLARIYLDEPAEAERQIAHARRDGYVMHHPIDMLRVVFHEGGHHLGYLWDEASLSAEMRAGGFVEPTRWESGKSDDPDLCGLEGRMDAEQVDVMLVVEAIKPT